MWRATTGDLLFRNADTILPPHARKNLENLVDSLKLFENIEFRGFVTVEEKMKILSSSNALVFPSLCEGFGLVILESFSLQKPVLVSNVRPLSDIVSDNVNGYVLSPHNETEWVSAMKKIIDSPNVSENMGARGRELLEKDYNIEKMKNLILNMYNEVILNQHIVK